MRRKGRGDRERIDEERRQRKNKRGEETERIGEERRKRANGRGD